MPTHKERILAAMRGEAIDCLPYVPRLDLWYLANAVAGTLPAQHAGRSQNAISRAEGWALHHSEAEDLFDPAVAEDYTHRAIGIFKLRHSVVDFLFPEDVEITVQRDEERTRVEYRTPLGTVFTTMRYTQAMQRLGISAPVTSEFLIKSAADYPAAGYLFEHMRVRLNPARFVDWQADMGDDGVAVACALRGASPMQLIQRDFLDPTQFYFHYEDCQKELRQLVDQMTPLYEEILRQTAESPAEVVMWGSNFDDMLTYPPYFAKEIQPWIRHAAEVLGARGKLVLCHTDGENAGLMDLLRDSGLHVAESICPAPMTRLSLADYYARWGGHLTLYGGIPSTVVLADSTPEDEFESYLDTLFKVVAPGRGMIVGIADQVPPNADFSRLVRIGERIAAEGRLPLEAGGFRTPAAPPAPEAPAEQGAAPLPSDGAFAAVQQAVIAGDQHGTVEHVRTLVTRGVNAHEVLRKGLIAAMEVIGEEFSAGTAFIPEVLLASRAMTDAIAFLEPYLTAGAQQEEKARVLLGTVQGDLHSIGKNMVATMFKGVGYDVLDLGTNVSKERFVEMVQEYKPQILGLSALLTTTMLEMGHVIHALEAQNLRGQVKVLVGGAPISKRFAEEIGADGYAPDAVKAVALARQLLAPGNAPPA